MALAAHNIKPAPGSKQDKKRVGRGNSSGSGTYCGRGIKGQRARAGGKSGTLYIGIKRDIKRTPKLGGFKRAKQVKEVVNLVDLENKFESGDKITPWSLKDKGLISKPKNGVKILGKGELTKKLNFENCEFSKSAQEAVEEVGGSIAS